MTDHPAPDGGIAPAPLPALLAELALATPAVERRTAPRAVEYATRDRVFAAAEGSAASFRLTAEIARAAARTAGVAASPRGPGWVTLTSLDLDRYTRDRTVAWFELAYRLAAEERDRA